MKTRSRVLIVAAVVVATLAVNAAIFATARQSKRPWPRPDRKTRPDLLVQARCDVPGMATIRLAGRSFDPGADHEGAFWLAIHRYSDINGPPVLEEVWMEGHERIRGKKGQITEDAFERAYRLPPGRYLVRGGLADLKKARPNEDGRPPAVRPYFSQIRSAVVDVE